MSKGVILSSAMESALNEMIEKVRASVDMDKVRELIAEQCGLEGIDSIDFADGSLMAENNVPVLKMDYSVLMNVPLYFDLQGNLLEIAETPVETEQTEEVDAEEEDVDSRFNYAGMQAGTVTRTF